MKENDMDNLITCATEEDVKMALEGMDQVARWHPTGSAYTCNPPVTDTDIDYLVLCAEGTHESYVKDLLAEGWQIGGSVVEVLGGQDDFQSVRKGKVNLIIIGTLSYFDRLVTATNLAKKLNLMDKKDRVALFEVVADQNLDFNIF